MKERPILFSAPMVRAILDGSKTQTRRIVKPQPAYPDAFSLDRMEWNQGRGQMDIYYPGATLPGNYWRCPYGQVGDRLWVREAHGFRQQYKSAMDDGWQVEVEYSDESRDWVLSPEKVTEQPNIPKVDGYYAKRPSIHMPRWASRITLEITEVRVQRLWDITHEDALAEGAQTLPHRCAGTPENNRFITEPELEWCREPSGICDCRRCGFKELWQSIHGGPSWKENPWVWAISFKKVQP